MFTIRNDVTGRVWETASRAEAKMYAVGGGFVSIWYTVFRSGSPCGLLAAEI